MALISAKDHVLINGPETFGAAWICSLLFMQYRSPVSCIDILPALNYTDRLLPQSDGKTQQFFRQKMQEESPAEPILRIHFNDF